LILRNRLTRASIPFSLSTGNNCGNYFLPVPNYQNHRRRSA
jgi:hypothetical protein